MYGEGISREGDLIDLAVTQRVIEKSGAWFSYKGDRLGQGRENAKQSLKENPDLLKKIENDVKTRLGIAVKATPAEGTENAAAAGKSGK
jgi:recombination protein RecA